MKARYRIIRRGLRGGAFYCVDTRTGKRTSQEGAQEFGLHALGETFDTADRVLSPAGNLGAKINGMGSDVSFSSIQTIRTLHDAFSKFSDFYEKNCKK